MGWFVNKDSVRALRKRGEGLALLRQVRDETRSAEDRTKALQALAELAAEPGACSDALGTLSALLDLVLGDEVHQLRETFVALFVQLANANKYVDRTPAADLGRHHEPQLRQFLEKFSDPRVLVATLQRQREYYRDPTLGSGGSIDAYKEYDPDRMKLLPLALLLCAGREREQLAFMAKDPNPIFRACFLEVAPKAGDLTHLPFILESTTDAFAEVRQRGFRALVVIGQPMAPKLVEFLEARAADSPDLVDFCAKVFNQPKFKLLATLIEQGRSRLGPRPDPKAVAALGRLYEQYAQLTEPEAKPVALALFQKLSSDHAPAALLAIACRMLDPEVAAHKARLEELVRVDHPCREEANRKLVRHRLGGLDPWGGELDLHDLLARGLVRLEVLGESITVVTAAVTNTTGVPLKVRLPSGTLFLASGHWQDMVSTAAVRLELEPGTTHLRIPVACARAELPIPKEGNGFRGVARAKGDLAKLMESIAWNNRYSSLVIQAAVWAVTDSYSGRRIQERLVDARTGARVITPEILEAAQQLLKHAGIERVL